MNGHLPKIINLLINYYFFKNKKFTLTLSTKLEEEVS